MWCLSSRWSLEIILSETILQIVIVVSSCGFQILSDLRIFEVTAQRLLVLILVEDAVDIHFTWFACSEHLADNVANDGLGSASPDFLSPKVFEIVQLQALFTITHEGREFFTLRFISCSRKESGKLDTINNLVFITVDHFEKFYSFGIQIGRQRIKCLFIYNIPNILWILEHAFLFMLLANGDQIPILINFHFD